MSSQQRHLSGNKGNVAGKRGMQTSSFLRGELVAFTHGTGRAVHGLENLVDVAGSEVRGDAGPCSVEDGFVHCLTRGMAHAFVQP